MTKVQEELAYRKILSSLLVSIFLCPLSAHSAVVEGDVSKVGEATHVEFSGKGNWDYDVTRTPDNRVVLKLPAFDKKTENLLTSWKDSLVRDIKINTNGENGQYEVSFQLDSNKVESFDYLTDQPSRLILDFYKVEKAVESAKANEGTSSASKVAESDSTSAFRPNVKRVPSKSIDDKSYEAIGGRKPAASELLSVGRLKNLSGKKEDDLDIFQGVFDGGDPYYSRFRVKDYEIKEEAIIASRQNIYTKFPMLKLKTSRTEEIYNNPPEYVINPKDDKENKEARLLLTLYEKERYAVFLKTYEYFINQHPDSIYDEIVRNLYADVQNKLWKRDKSPVHYEKFISALKYLINKYPDSVMTERLEQILAYSSLDRGDGYATIQRFLKFIEKYKESSDLDQAKKALAEGYLNISKYQDALNVLEDLEKTADEKTSSIEARYRMGDVFFKKGEFEKAIETYTGAIKKYPGYEGKFPNANYNMAEALFWLGNYKPSLDHYVRYLELFPSDDHGGYALTRVGEVLDILGADKKKVIGAYLESYYRFRESEGAQIARIRLLSQKMKGMKKKAMEKSISEIQELAKTSKLPRMEEFATLMIADGLHRRGEYNDAMGSLIKYYQRNPTSTDVTFFRKRILKNIGDLMKESISSRNFLEVLKIYSEYNTTWLKSREREDIKYFVGRSYEMAGVYAEAKNVYSKTLEKLKSIKGTREEIERRVNEHLPSISAVHLRLAATNAQLREFKNAFDNLSEIKETDSLTPPEKVEMVELTALVAERQGRIDLAKRNLNELIEAWQGKPELLATTFVSLAELEFSSKKYSKAEEVLLEVQSLKDAGEEVDPDVWFKALELKGRVLEKLNRKVAAVESYSRILDEFEGQRPVGSIRYRAGKILFEAGNVKGAEKLWNGLDQQKNAMYLKLAKEKLANAKWEDEYNKYINRLPASSRLKRRKK